MGSLIAAFAVSVIGNEIQAMEPLSPTFRAVHRLTMFVAFLTWMAALGGIGSIAFVGMNALAVIDDITFDITNEKLVGFRILLGALFGIVITIPFGYAAFTEFISSLFDPPAPTKDLVLNSVFLMLPFVLGFSTTLVIMILSQLVDAVQTFFGSKRRPDHGAVPPATAAGAAAQGH